MNETIYLTRNFSSNKACYGMIHNNFRPIVMTLELCWRQNEINRSCIPIGLYPIEIVTDVDKGNKRYINIYDVPGRSSIEIHAGNVLKDTKGCIITGLSYDTDGNIEYPSTLALDILLKYIEYHDIKFLRVCNVV